LTWIRSVELQAEGVHIVVNLCVDVVVPHSVTTRSLSSYIRVYRILYHCFSGARSLEIFQTVDVCVRISILCFICIYSPLVVCLDLELLLFILHESVCSVEVCIDQFTYSNPVRCISFQSHFTAYFN
jgi:hypothetical protein